MTSQSSEINSLRTLYYLNNFHTLIREVEVISKKKLSKPDQKWKEFFLISSYLKNNEFNKIHLYFNNHKSDLSQIYTILLKIIENPNNSKKSQTKLIKELKIIAESKKLCNDPITAILTATAFIKFNDLRTALETLYNFKKLDHSMLRIQIFLKINRVDLALIEVESMKKIDDEDVCTIISSCVVSLFGDELEKVQDSYREIQDLVDTYGGSCLLFELQSMCMLIMGDKIKAGTLMKEAQELHLENNEDITLDMLKKGLIISNYSYNTKKSAKIIEKILKIDSNNEYFVYKRKLEKEFDACAAKYLEI